MHRPPATDTPALQDGQRIAVTQQIPQRQRVWTIRTEGIVLDISQRPTGAWYTHSRGGKLWLDRLTLKKDDGEEVVCILDQYSHVEILREVAPAEDDASPDADDDGPAIPDA